MVNRKISKLLGRIFGIVGFMLIIGVLEVPALANDNLNTNSAYCENTSLYKDKDYLININKSVEQNGFKVTLDKAIATKHKLKVMVKVESEKPFDENKYDNLMDSIVKVTFGNNNNRVNKHYDYINDKILLITIEEENNKEEYPEKGDIRVAVELPAYKVNVGIGDYVDFSESFKNTIEKDIFTPVPQFDFTLNKLEYTAMGTRIFYSGPYRDFFYKENNPGYLMNSFIILKVGDRMYKTKYDGCYYSDDAEKNKLRMGSYSAKTATYERVKDKKDISVIPVICDMSSDEINQIIKGNLKNRYYEKRKASKQTINNISYLKSFEFSDGSKGEIYNIERNDNTIKVYCRGSSEKESLLMANNMVINYNLGENELEQDSFYKDSNDNFGYVVEFNNIEKDKILDLNFVNNINLVDRYKIVDEVEISK
ncbi:hypothetical protein [Clostridium uliginosum]|uniref:DUF4179 domain-containing protein n=1 Tax=Clostridium uliginosum TaxID=119641 RepID=A0A1I1S8R3_9CLOT|nr:hypothetical protein [Clostridium uliginosum]SFD42885.1 protein of unknown function [Clostridium uliginosum]